MSKKQNKNDNTENKKTENSEPAASATSVLKETLMPVWTFVNKYKNKAFNIFTYAASISIFVYVIAALIGYIVNGYKPEFHSDCTDTIMWANASIEGGGIYDKDFTYACFLPFGINIIMQPLIGIFGLGMKAHIGGMLGYFILLTLFLFLMFREMHMGLRGRCLACSLVLSMTCSSVKLREIFWQHTIYYSLGILFIVIGLFLYFHFINLSEAKRKLPKDDKKNKMWLIRMIVTYVCFAVFIMLTATDGISALSIFAVPFAAGLLADFFLDPDNKIFSKEGGKRIGSVAVVGLMIVLGGKLNKFWLGDMDAWYQDQNSVYSGMDTWIDHIHNMPMAWLRLNGVKDMGGQQLSEKPGFTNLLYIASALIIILIPIIATLCYSKYKKAEDARMLRVAVWMHWVSSAIVLLGYICGILSVADWRLTSILGTSLIVSILFVFWGLKNKISAGRFTALLLVPMIAVSFTNISNMKKLPGDYKKANDLYQLTEYLEDNDLTYGFATFWHANAITLLSDSDVRVREVTVNETGVYPRAYQSSKKWYAPQEGQDKYFILLIYYEYDCLVNNNLPILNEVIETKEVNINNSLYKIIVFDHYPF